MKCEACGYYHLKNWQIEQEDEIFQEETRKNNGDKEFIEINGTFTCKVYDAPFSPLKEVFVYACPKCRTLRIN